MESVRQRELEPQPIIIERGRAEDAAEMAGVIAQSWVAAYSDESLGLTEEKIRQAVYGEDGEQLAKRAKRLERQMNGQGKSRAILVARQGDRIIGVSSSYQDVTGRQWIGSFYTLPDAWGKGVGQKFMTSTLAWHGGREVGLHVASHNKRAIRFYQKHGFEPTGEESVAKFAGIRMLILEMVRTPVRRPLGPR